VSKRSRRWWIFGGALLLGLAAVLALALPYRPVPVVGPAVAPAPLELPPPLPGLRLHVFDTGANRMSPLLVGADPPWRPVPAFVVEHPERGLVVFDLGLSHEVAARGQAALPLPMRWLMESRGRVGFTLDEQMRRAGLRAGDVAYVVVSHLHEDHTGVAASFAGAVFLAGPGTRAQVLAGAHSPFPPDVVPDWREIDFEARGQPVGPFASGVDLFDDGSITLIAAGGHTAQDVMMLVDLPAGPVPLTGDAVVHYDWLESDDVERIASDPERAADVRNRVRALLASGDATIIPGHDLRRLGPARPDLIVHAAPDFAGRPTGG